MRQDQALAILQSGASTFITGAPGSGKTYLLNRFIAEEKNIGKNIAITASTGIAATHLNGQTLHSWSGLGIATSLTDDLYKQIRTRRKKAINAADVLIIDEVSMTPAWLFDLVDQVCRKIRNDSTPFGGLQVVLSGDFYQLPPVVKAWQHSSQHDVKTEEFRNRYKDRNPDGFITESFVWSQMGLQICYLTEQHRQNNGELLTVLTDIRQGTITDHDRNILLSRCHQIPLEDQVAVRLFPTNVQADRLNDQQLADLAGEEHVFLTESFGQSVTVKKLKQSVLAPDHLILKQGAAVMALRNDLEHHYVNGSLGTVIDFLPESKGGYPLVEFENGYITVIRPASWKMIDGDTTLAEVTQIPLRCAWGITIHKSQGMTLDAAMMDLRRTFTAGMGYVALSRVETLQGLFLEDINEKAFLISPYAQQLDQELKDLSEAVVQQLETEGIDSFSFASGSSLF